jgi:hypothetical protein
MMRIILIIILTGAVFACKQKKTKTQDSISSEKKPALQSEIQAWPSPYWSAKGKVYIQMGGSNIPVNLSLRAEQGKALWFSASAFGLMEVARGKVDQDSVRILDKFNNRCIRSGLQGLGNYLPVSMGIHQLQHFLMGRVFWDSLEAGNRLMKNDTLKISGLQAGVRYTADIMAKFNLIKADASLEGADINLKNNDFRDISGFPVAFDKELRSRTEFQGKTQEAGIRIDFSRFEFLQKAPDLDFALPDDCTPMELK